MTSKAEGSSGGVGPITVVGGGLAGAEAAWQAAEAGLAVTDVSEATGFPEMMDGRVKTLHPVVHGGLLGRAGTDDAVMAAHGIAAIDLLVLNLYPFERVSADPSSSLEEIVENIDIGGPAMLRSAAKNFARVAVATDPAQYGAIVAELDANALAQVTAVFAAVTRFAADAPRDFGRVPEALRKGR